MVLNIRNAVIQLFCKAEWRYWCAFPSVRVNPFCWVNKTYWVFAKIAHFPAFPEIRKVIIGSMLIPHQIAKIFSRKHDLFVQCFFYLWPAIKMPNSLAGVMWVGNIT